MYDTIYTLQFRPISTFTLPPGIKWEYVGAPHDLHTRPDLPRSHLRFGTFRVDRALTASEMRSFEIVQTSLA